VTIGDVPRAQASVPAAYNKSQYPRTEQHDPVREGVRRARGQDIVVFTWGALVQRSLLAAQQAEKERISVAVVDLRRSYRSTGNDRGVHAKKPIASSSRTRIS
jgi:deoxyxylulose-5-phosphate synthase